MTARRKWSILLWIGLSILILAIAAWLLLLRPAPPERIHDPVESFNHGSIGNEAQQGIPYWIWRVLPTIFPDYLPGNQDGYASLGFYWKQGSELPVGFTKRTIGVVPRVAFNCAFCHQGSYRLKGDGKSTLVPAGAGTRLQPQNYQRFLMNAAADARFNAKRILAEVDKIHKMPFWERTIYRYIMIPLTRIALQKTAVQFGWMETKPDWGTGRIDPFNPVKYDQLELPVDATIGNSDMMPLLGVQKILDRNETYGMHWDGLNTDFHEVAVSGGLGDGMTYSEFRKLGDQIQAIEDFARLQEAPPSPFSVHRERNDPYFVDDEQVTAGKAIYEENCALCHDVTGHRFRKVIPVLEVNTDRHRIDMWTEEALKRYSKYDEGGPWVFDHFQNVEGYIAPGFDGLWLRGPYLHNGSVPTLADLLNKPEARPGSFCRGLDEPDPVKGGFIAPLAADSSECGTLFFYDTAVAGNGNGGHLYGTDLPPSDKQALLAYLKTR